MRRTAALACLVAAGLAVALVASGLAAAQTGLTPVEPRSPNAERIHDTYYLLLVFVGAIFVLVEASLIVFIVKYRGRGRSRDDEGPQVTGNTNLEIAWTVVPILILFVIGSYVFYKLPGIKDPPAAAAGTQELVVRVEGHQFYWEFEYPNGVVAVDRLRAPQGGVVRLEVTAPEHDVIHSWWIPALGGKIDAIPGRTNETWFRADRPGFYRGQCAEFCGIQHAAMLAGVEVLPGEEFDAWLAGEGERQEQGTSTLGASLYKGACAKCHGFEREGLIGPALPDATIANADVVRAVVRDGGKRMPPVGADWSDRQLDALLAFLRTEAAEEGSDGS